MKKNLQQVFLFSLISLLLLIPLYMWMPYANFKSNKALFLSLGQAAALTGYVLYLLNFILSSRYKILDKIFAGINRMYISHHLYGVSAFILLLLHPVFLSLSYLSVSLLTAYEFILPSFGNWPQLAGSVALFVTIILLVITLYVKLEYDRWKITHKFLGAGLFFAAIHMLFIGSTLAVNFPLRMYYYFLTLMAVVSYLRKTVLGKYLIKRYGYKVESVNVSGEILKISLKKDDNEKFIFKPGQFVFAEFLVKGIPKESHPFSITSGPNESLLTFGVKVLGGFTESLTHLKKGDTALIEGPYGMFGYSFFPNPNQIWIAGGIGITPFVSMAKNIPDKINASLYYLVSDKNEAVYFEELKEIDIQRTNLKLILWESKEKGRFSINNIEDQATSDKEYFVCGPPMMMKSLKNQLISIKIPQKQIHTEEFALS